MAQYIKTYTYIGLLVVVLVLLCATKHFQSQTEKYKKLYNTELINTKAYESTISKDKKQSIVYQQSIAQLQQSNDSMTKELLDVQKKLKVKPKTVVAMSYQTSTVYKTDTIVLNDTIFKTDLHIDTTLTDNQWYTLHLDLQYPSSIAVSPKFKSERYIVVNTKKEYINKPSKIFFIRWFQKKHTVLQVNIEEKNPYINIEQQKFIKVIQ